MKITLRVFQHGFMYKLERLITAESEIKKQPLTAQRDNIVVGFQEHVFLFD